MARADIVKYEEGSELAARSAAVSPRSARPHGAAE